MATFIRYRSFPSLAETVKEIIVKISASLRILQTVVCRLLSITLKGIHSFVYIQLANLNYSQA